ncbi:hypothetical protein [uncultured Acinetobacter sp.]|uniref:hypothetical protein n=1 Tax=uncultured Acinetobacter sp. TaxID=165433 RepID=UPI0025839804|nr:hypothetical protein [uncultured Acinetobacter sp.]
MFKNLVLMFGLIFSSLSYADENINSRKIIDIGCHVNDGICYVRLDGPEFGSTLGCSITSTNQFRFDNANSVNGKRAFAALYAAFLTQKVVDVYLSGCTSQGSPQLLYYHVH